MDRLFPFILIAAIALFFTAGGILYSMGRDDLLLESRPAEAIQTTFVMEEQKPQPKEEPKPRPQPAKKAADDTPIDLTKKPPEPEREVRPDPPPEEQSAAKQEDKPQERPPARQVYGLKQVFSQGLGAGGSSQDAIVGRLGNTTNKPYDTLTATADDLKSSGRPAAAPQPVSSAASVTKHPRLKSGFRNLKPQYSKEMLQNRAEGAVRARLLIGTDGKVRNVEITSDIGYDSAEIAKEFLMTLEFEPAMKGDDAVSVWIPFSIRFELI
jgi:outer membrane biosynthesis protein TonB